jgi:hypothetical protein
MNLNKAEKRSKKQFKRKNGMRVDGSSCKLILEILRKKGEIARGEK